jgi:uncharacterized protein (TIGR00725 family)
MPQKLVAVCGQGAGASENVTAMAEEVGKELARAGLTLVTGGRGGVMEAASRGAKSEGGLTIGILPGYNRDEANPYIDIPVCTGIREARNLVIVASARIVIVVGGEWGTLSEIALARKLERPVIVLSGFGWKIGRENPNDDFVTGLYYAHNPAETIKMALELLR